MNTIIKYEHITKSYGDHEIIHDLELNIEAGDFVTIIGSSGSGKTTVLKMVNGLIKPTSGHLYVEGKDINDVDLIDLRRHIGYAIRPCQRGKGYGKALLRLLLPHGKEHGIDHALITVQNDNAASIRVALQNGGRIEKANNIRHYIWIDC